MATALVREPLDAKSIADLTERLGSCDDLAAAASERLGYTSLKQDLPRLRKEAAFRQVLVDLGISPFNRESVERYKAKAAWRATPATTRAVTYLGYAVVMLLVGSTAVLTVSLLGCFTAWFFTSVPGWLQAIAMFSACTGLFGFAAAYIVGVWTERRMFLIAEWEAVRIGRYEGSIPEFALQTALDLNERCPHAKFFVEELQNTPTFDPFLIADDGAGNQYYLEVWNEPGFIQERAA